MTAEEYIAELTRLLYSVPEPEREEAVAFYRESIADRIDDGLSEEEAVASLVSPAEAACAILSNRAETEESAVSEVADASAEAVEAASMEPVRPVQPASFWTRLKHGQLTPWEWVGVVLGSIIWLPLLAAAFGVAVGVVAVIFSLYLCLWVLIACVWITGAALVVAAPANVVFILWGAQLGNVSYVLVNAGYSLIAFGGGMWILRGALKLTKLFLRAHKKVACAITKAPYVPEVPTASVRRPGVTTFFTVCLILLGAGFASVLAGYVLSGFDWRIFITSFNRDGSIYIGGTLVEHPEQLLFGRPLFSWR